MKIPDIIRAVQGKLHIDIDGDPGQQTWTAIFHALGCQEPTPMLDVFSESVIDANRAAILAAAKAIVGRTEKTGHNDGPEIDEILASCGLAGKQEPYCGATIRFVYNKAGLRGYGPGPADAAWSPNWSIDSVPTWTRASGGMTPKPGDTFGIWNNKLDRVGHCGIVVKWAADYVVTVEGNTSNFEAIGTEADRNGDGVYMKRRRTSEIYAVRNWLDIKNAGLA